MKRRLLEAQLAEDTINDDGQDNLSPLSHLALEACQCKHLQRWLPHTLDLTCAVVESSETDSSMNGNWIMANPVHALHMTSHLEPDGATVFLPKDQPRGEPALYGEEQRRLKVLQTSGISPAAELVVANSGTVQHTDDDVTRSRDYISRSLVPTTATTTTTTSSSSSRTMAAMPPPPPTPTSQSKQMTVPINSERTSLQGTMMNVVPRAQPPPAVTSAGRAIMRRPLLPSGIVPPRTPVAVAATTSTSSLTSHSATTSNQPQFAHILPKLPNHPFQVHAHAPPSSGATATATAVPVGVVGAPPTSTLSNVSTGTRSSTSLHSSSCTSNKPQFLLDEERFQELRRREDALLRQRHCGSSSASIQPNPRRNNNKQSSVTVNQRNNKVKSSSSSSIKRSSSRASDAPSAARDAATAVPLLPNGLFVKTVVKVTDFQKWQDEAQVARATVEEWMERFRFNRRAHWREQEQQQRRNSKATFSAVEFRQCQLCSTSCLAGGDDVMQCLECSFIGCTRHMMHHSLRSHHNIAVTCGERAEVFCFKCGDFVYHPVFDQERERMDVSRHLPWMGWHEHPVQRSFDPMQFLRTVDCGIVWRGMIAAYPPLVPDELVRASRMSMRRLMVTRGDLASPSSLSWGSQAQELALYQKQKEATNAWMIQAPVGMYNLGNTCFMTCILQCLVHCVPLQRYFLGDVGHHYMSCALVRSAFAKPDTSDDASSKKTSRKSVDGCNKSSICLACEMDKLFLHYLGSSIGKDFSRAVCQASHPLDRFETPYTLTGSTVQNSSKTKCFTPDDVSTTVIQGDPLVTTSLLAAAWKSGGMNHLAGYEQGDAHEFLQAFLDTMGKHVGEYRKLLRFMQRMALPSYTKDEPTERQDVVKQLFEGTLRSVLICNECGCKRKMPEPFLNVSLPLSKHLGESNASGGTRNATADISLQRCLEQFAAPESLADPVDCPSCRKKTATKKQHTFAKLPKVLCLHLKRFDAAKNRKIDDFVSFPAHGLDMGKLLPHWCETFTGESTMSKSADSTSPRVLYELFATANHKGTLHQGHYVANVKVKDQWYHCNDSHVSKCDESDVLNSEGAYVLFYIRQ